jgi:methionine synthase II (cobalamin-independent)
MNSSFLFPATGVGSLPHLNPQEACGLIFSNFKEIPYWPQLVQRSFLENMYVQFSEGLPGVIIDQNEKKIYVDTSSENFVKELETCYECCLADTVDYFAISQDYAAGLYEFTNYQLPITNYQFVKGQVTGPISFGLSVTDENKRPLIYHKEFAEILTKVISMKARWQIKKFKIQNSKFKIIVFIDEPYLVSIGSGFVSLKRKEVIKIIDDVVSAIHREGGLAGVHCCGNTDWSILLETELDILNFDAYNYFASLSLYPEELKGFLRRGGVLAWGIVPTAVVADSIETQALIKRFEMNLKVLIDKGLKKEDILNSFWITPSCGCGTLTVELAERIHNLTAEVSQRLREKYL